jgi:hypothetical protein
MTATFSVRLPRPAREWFWDILRDVGLDLYARGCGPARRTARVVSEHEP